MDLYKGTSGQEGREGGRLVGRGPSSRALMHAARGLARGVTARRRSQNMPNKPRRESDCCPGRRGFCCCALSRWSLTRLSSLSATCTSERSSAFPPRTANRPKGACATRARNREDATDQLELLLAVLQGEVLGDDGVLARKPQHLGSVEVVRESVVEVARELRASGRGVSVDEANERWGRRSGPTHLVEELDEELDLQTGDRASECAPTVEERRREKIEEADAR